MTDPRELLEQYRAGTCSDSERQYIEQWLLHYRASDPAELTDADYLRLRATNWESVRAETIAQPKPKQRRITWLPYAAAAILLACVLLLWNTDGQMNGNKDEKMKEQRLAVTEILPGGNKATLTLADGRVVELSDTHEGIVIADENINYQDGTAIALSSDGGDILRLDHPSAITYSTLHTPKGSMYSVTLSDGSKVWLNAASTLRYPSRFDGHERVVELEGEAFFEVAQIRKSAHAQMRKGSEVNQQNGVSTHQPFKVVSRGQTVEVLGTQFNIAAYADDATTQTTLVTGRVRISSTEGGRDGNRDGGGQNIELTPGQQSTLFDGKILVERVDTDTYTSWRHGYFSFHQATIQRVLKQLSRWYDIEVVYEGTPPTALFNGEIGRDLSLQQVLKGLSTTRIPYRIEGRTLTIMGTDTNTKK